MDFMWKTFAEVICNSGGKGKPLPPEFFQPKNQKTMRNLRNFVILALMLMALVNCQREEDLVNGGVSTEAETLASKSVDELSFYGRNYIKAFKELTQSSEFVNLVKTYYESRVADSTFGYVVSLEELSREYSGDFDELLRNSLDGELAEFVISSYRGFNIGGKTLKPELFIFYYAPQFKEIAEWDGGSVEEIVYNYDVNDKFYGYRLDGSVVEYPDIDGRLLNSGKWVLQWVNKDGGYHERPILRGCECFFSVENKRCKPMDNLGGWCGVGRDGGSWCIGYCGKSGQTL